MVEQMLPARITHLKNTADKSKFTHFFPKTDKHMKKNYTSYPLIIIIVIFRQDMFVRNKTWKNIRIPVVGKIWPFKA
jgi:hypothetical protein